MKAGGRAIYLHPGWEHHSKHSVEKKGGGSPWGSRPSHSAQRRDWSQSPFCSERRRSAPDAMLAREHGSPGEQNKAWQAGAQLGARLWRALFQQYSMETTPPGVTQHWGLDLGSTHVVSCPYFMDSKTVPNFPEWSHWEKPINDHFHYTVPEDGRNKMEQ